jgi:hypothetical protein
VVDLGLLMTGPATAVTAAVGTADGIATITQACDGARDTLASIGMGVPTRSCDLPQAAGHGHMRVDPFCRDASRVLKAARHAEAVMYRRFLWAPHVELAYAKDGNEASVGFDLATAHAVACLDPLPMGVDCEGPSLTPETVSAARLAVLQRALVPLRPFVPRYHGNRPIPAQHPLANYKGGKFPIEIALENLLAFSPRGAEAFSDAAFGSDPSQFDIFPACGRVASTVCPTRCVRDDASSTASFLVPLFEPNTPSSLSASSGLGNDSCDTTAAATWRVVESLWHGQTSIFDLKVGRRRHMRDTMDLERRLAKDHPTTGPAIGLRMCGMHLHGLSVTATTSPPQPDDEPFPACVPGSGEYIPLLDAVDTLPALFTASRRKDKVIGRALSPSDLLAALHEFCSTLELAGEEDAPNTRWWGGQELSRYYHSRVCALIAALEARDALAHFSFASSSLLLMHRLELVRLGVDGPAGATAFGARHNHYYGIRVTAAMRWIDFAASGPLHEPTVGRETVFYRDSVIGMRFGLGNLERILAAVAAGGATAVLPATVEIVDPSLPELPEGWKATPVPV